MVESLEERRLLANGVIINEFLASNSGGKGFQDPAGNYPDWIELYNPTGAAVDLSGWKLRDSASTWVFPTGSSINANGYLVVAADGANSTVLKPIMHTNFSLAKGGEYLGLLKPDDTVASEFLPQFPQQTDDVSYGITTNTLTTTLVGPTAPLKAFIPTDNSVDGLWRTEPFDDTSWLSGNGGAGFDADVTPPAAPAGWTVKLIDTSTGTISNIGQATDLLDGFFSGYTINSNTTATYSSLDFLEGGHFGLNQNLPNGFGVANGTGVPERQQIAMRATARVFIPQGTYTVGVNSDEGFQLTIPGARFTSRINENNLNGAINSGSNQLTYAGTRFSSDSFGTFTVGAGGLTTDIRLDYFNATGGSNLEMFVATGTATSFNPATFALLGNGTAGWQVRQTGPDPSYQGMFGINLQTPMRNVSSSAYVRVPFNVLEEDLPAYNSLLLHMKYDDGFVAWINGQQVASQNAPGAPDFQSAATQSRADSQAVLDQDFSIPITPGLLHAGTNYLYVQGLNASAADSDFLIVPSLDAVTGTADVQRYFANPTPGAANNTSFTGKITDTKFDHDRGFYDAPFQLAITTPTGGTTIRYTTDGTEPSEINGTIYTGPITIDKTTTIRARAFKTGYLPTNIDTETYIFLSDVITQSASTTNSGTPMPGFPASWNFGSGQVTDYGMDPRVVNDSRWAGTIKNDLKSIPTLSIVTDSNNLWGPQGIYSNPSGSGIAWERPASLELINPDGSKGFQIDFGIRIRGGYSRSTGNPKHGLRVLLRNEYGKGELDYPLFKSMDGSDTNRGFDLRTFENYSWSFDPNGKGLPNGARFIGLRDQFSRDTQFDMGDNAERGDFYNLYINGMYFGIYNTAERPEADNAVTYYGGTTDDYDVIKVDPQSGYTIVATDGNKTGWQAFYDMANQLRSLAATGADTTALYQQMMGNNPNGTRNPNYPVYLDTKSLIDYMLVIFYGGNLDAPISNFLGNTSPNNFYGVWNHTTKAMGFQFFAHDSEHTLLEATSAESNRLGPFTAGQNDFTKSNPQWIFQQLLYNKDFRTLVSDYIHKNFFNGGALTYEKNVARFMKRMKEINRAIVGESARWGDAKSGGAPYLYTAPYSGGNATTQNWQNNINTVLYTFFPQRNAFLMTNFRNQVMGSVSGQGNFTMYPSFDAPEFTDVTFNGSITPGQVVHLSNPSSVGTIYYTTDGSDPRLPGGALNPNALVYSPATGITLNGTTRVQARILNGTNWSAVTDSTFTNTTPPGLRITEIMYHPQDPPPGSAYAESDFEYIEVQNVSGAPLNVNKFALTNGVKFTFPNQVLAAGAKAVIVANVAAFQSRYGNAIPILGTFTGLLDNSGEKVTLAGSFGETIQSFEYQDSWQPQTDGEGFALEVRDPNQALALWDDNRGWRSSTSVGGDPGTDVAFVPGDAVVVNELAANVATPNTTWIELRNTTNTPVDISNWFLTNDPANLKKYQIPAGTIIPANGLLVLNEQTSYGQVGGPGALIPFTFDGNGDNTIVLSQADAAGNLLGYRQYQDYGATALGQTLGRVTKSTGDVDFTITTAPTPGAANSSAVVNPVVISEVMYGPIQKFGATASTLTDFPNPNLEYVELRNTTNAPIQLFDPANPTNTWRITGGMNFTFPQNITIPAYGFVILTNLSPTDFRAMYTSPAVPASAIVLGPVKGHLDNNGDKLRLQKPGTPVNGIVPYIEVDRLNYDNKNGWPTSADEGGFSLIRTNLFTYGNDVTNWQASPAIGGSPGANNLPATAPVVNLSSPTSTANEGTPWTFNGSFTDFDLGETYFVQASWNDGSGTSTVPVNPDRTFTLTHTFSDNSPPGSFFPVTVKVTDSSSKVGQATVNVTVNNVAPTGTLGVVGNPTSVPEGGAASVTFTGVTDPGTRDSQPAPIGGYKYSYDFNNDGIYDVVDSTNPTVSVPASFLVDGPKTLTIKGKVADKDGGFTEYSIPLTVRNVVPAVDPIDDQNYAAAPGTLNWVGTFSDPGVNDTFTGTVDWNYHPGDTDGTPITVNPDGSFALNRTFNGAGTFVVRVRVKDKDGGVGFTDFTVNVASDTVAPTVVGSQFLYQTGPRKVAVTFSEDVGASLTPGSVTVHNLTTNTDVPSTDLTLAFDQNTNTATWSWAAGALPADGNYHVTLNPAGIKDTSNNALAQGTSFDFYFLNGDANRDRFVDFNDLVPLAQNYNSSVAGDPNAFQKGDFNGDGLVDFNDLVTLAQRYNTGLPAPAAGVPQGTVAIAGAPMPSMTALVAAMEQPGYVAPVVHSKFPATTTPPTPKPTPKPAPKPSPKPVVVGKPKAGPVKKSAVASAATVVVPPSSVFSTKKVATAKKTSDLLA